MINLNKSGIAAPLLKALKNSLAGLRTAWLGERAFRQECAVLLILCIALLAAGSSPARWLLALGGWLGVMAAELLNSAVEKTCDLVSTDFHPLIKAAKDMASAAIFLMLCLNAGIWIYLLAC